MRAWGFPAIILQNGCIHHMADNFWEKIAGIKRPFFVLAPMDDITNLVFRKIVARCGKPDVFFTEFVSADGLASREGRKNLMEKMKFSEKDRPVVVQFFGANAKHFRVAAKLAKDLRFDGIDINMGCPDRSVTSQGAGAALIKNPKLARKIIRATIEGAEGIPVSVKTRIGWLKDEVATWIPEILSEDIAALIVHGRIANRGYATPANWEPIKEAVKLAHEKNVTIIGNGDIYDYQNGLERAEASGVDGVMIGRAALKNPWIFNPALKPEEISVKDRLNLLLYHVKLFKEKFPKRNFSELKKYFAGYVSDFPGAKDLRIKLMTAENPTDVKRTITPHLE